MQAHGGPRGCGFISGAMPRGCGDIDGAMPRVWMFIVCMAAMITAAHAVCAAQIGRLSPLSKLTASAGVTIGNAGYSLDIQKGLFKTSVLTPQLAAITGGSNYGNPIYAGAVSMRGASGYWLYDNPGTGYTYSVSQGQTGFYLGQAVMSITEPSWAGSLTAKLAAGYPNEWYTYTRTSGAGAIHGGLMGYDWAGRTAPTALTAGTAASQTSYTRSGTLTITPSGAPYYLVYQDSGGGGFSGCLRFDVAPASITVDNVSVQWDYASPVSTANMEYLPVAPSLTTASIIWISGLFPAAPTALSQSFASDASGNPQVTISAAGSSNMMLPAAAGAPNGSVSTVEGTLGIKTGAPAMPSRCRFRLK